MNKSYRRHGGKDSAPVTVSPLLLKMMGRRAVNPDSALMRKYKGKPEIPDPIPAVEYVDPYPPRSMDKPDQLRLIAILERQLSSKE